MTSRRIRHDERNGARLDLATMALIVRTVSVLDRVCASQSAAHVDAGSSGTSVLREQIRRRQRTLGSYHSYLGDPVHDEQLPFRNHSRTRRIELDRRKKYVDAGFLGPAANFADRRLPRVEPLKHVIGVAAMRRNQSDAGDENATSASSGRIKLLWPGPARR